MWPPFCSDPRHGTDSHCRNQNFWVGGPKNLFFVTNEFNCIKIYNKAIFLSQLEYLKFEISSSTSTNIFYNSTPTPWSFHSYLHLYSTSTQITSNSTRLLFFEIKAYFAYKDFKLQKCNASHLLNNSSNISLLSDEFVKCFNIIPKILIQ